jgi:hypothetical protein
MDRALQRLGGEENGAEHMDRWRELHMDVLRKLRSRAWSVSSASYPRSVSPTACTVSELGIETLSEQAGDVRRTFAYVSKADRLFGYSAEVTFEDGTKCSGEWLFSERACAGVFA